MSNPALDPFGNGDVLVVHQIVEIDDRIEVEAGVGGHVGWEKVVGNDRGVVRGARDISGHRNRVW